MRILIDECVDQRLQLLFAGHDCQTAGHAKLSGLKNGALVPLVRAVIKALETVSAGQVIRVP